MANRCFVIEVHTVGEPSALVAANNGIRSYNSFAEAVNGAHCIIDAEVCRLRVGQPKLAVLYERPTQEHGLVARILDDGILLKRVTVLAWGLLVPQ